MSQIHLIEKLERHIGFVYHRLNCDGNWFGDALYPEKLEVAMKHYVAACLNFRAALKNVDGDLTIEQVTKNIQMMMDSFDTSDYIDERESWE